MAGPLLISERRSWHLLGSQSISPFSSDFGALRHVAIDMWVHRRRDWPCESGTGALWRNFESRTARRVSEARATIQSHRYSRFTQTTVRQFTSPRSSRPRRFLVAGTGTGPRPL